MQLPITTAEQRSEIYEDVRKFLRPGFLAHSIDLNGSRIVLRSLTATDWELLRYRVSSDLLIEWKRWTVAVSTWMIQGQIVAGDEGVLHRVYEMCQKLPLTILNDAYEVVNALMRRMKEAAYRMSAFFYEDESRFMWRSEGFAMTTGSNILSGMGLNPIQKLWIYYNRSEDDSKKDQAEWDMAKFIVGPHAPKGIKKINAQDKKQIGDTKNKRQRLMDRCFYEAAGAIPREGEAVSKKGRFGDWDVYIAETPEELQEQMRRWVEDEKDDHDKVVAGAKARIKHEVTERRTQAKEQREALTKAMEEEGITPSRLVPLTGKAGQEFIERVKQRMPGTSKVFQDGTHNSAYDKYIDKNPEVGNLRVTSDGQITSTAPIDPEKLIEMLRKPEEGDEEPEGPSLQERIVNRRPTLEDQDPESGDRS